jgi:hypothetical protein
MAYHCHTCGYELILEVKVARRDCCENCGADLHCCLNCHFYDERADLCREDIHRKERYKDQSNFCQAFQLGETELDRKDEIADAKSRLDSLFKL